MVAARTRGPSSLLGALAAPCRTTAAHAPHGVEPQSGSAARVTLEASPRRTDRRYMANETAMTSVDASEREARERVQRRQRDRRADA